jgi:hypothetical protein
LNTLLKIMAIIVCGNHDAYFRPERIWQIQVLPQESPFIDFVCVIEALPD